VLGGLCSSDVMQIEIQLKECQFKGQHGRPFTAQSALNTRARAGGGGRERLSGQKKGEKIEKGRWGGLGGGGKRGV